MVLEEEIFNSPYSATLEVVWLSVRFCDLRKYVKDWVHQQKLGLDLSEPVSSRKMGAIIPSSWGGAMRRKFSSDPSSGKETMKHRYFLILCSAQPAFWHFLGVWSFYVVRIKSQGPEVVCFWPKHKWLLAMETD